jgi:hypothetical protein
MNKRWQEIITIWKQRPYLLNGIAGFIIGVMAFPLINLIEQDAQGLLESLVPEIFGIVVTVGVIDTIIRKRDNERELRELKIRLVWEAGSRSNDTAVRAIDELRHNRWLTGMDGLLKGARLEDANLENALMDGANLMETHLSRANLPHAQLRKANISATQSFETNLSSAKLGGANLSNSSYIWADFSGANLVATNLSNSDFSGANLSNTYLALTRLCGVNLNEAKLSGVRSFNKGLYQPVIDSMNKTTSDPIKIDKNIGAIFDENTILPDGSKWTEGRDMREFTHPEEWKAEQEAKANNT